MDGHPLHRLGERAAGLPAALALLLTLVVALAGGGGGDEEERPAGNGAGTKRHDVASHGFSIALPRDWRSIAPEDVLSGEELEELEAENPEIRRFIEAMRGDDSPIKYFAFDPDIEQEFATNLNVIVVPLGQEVAFDELRESTLAEVEALPTLTSEVTDERVELPAGDALRLTYRQQFDTGNGGQEVATTQYTFAAGDSAYVLTFTTLPGEEAAYRDVFRAAAESFRVD